MPIYFSSLHSIVLNLVNSIQNEKFQLKSLEKKIRKKVLNHVLGNLLGKCDTLHTIQRNSECLNEMKRK